MLGDNLAGTVIYWGKRTTDKRNTVSSCRGKLWKEQGPELDGNDDDDKEDVNNGDEKTKSRSMLRELVRFIQQVTGRI